MPIPIENWMRVVSDGTTHSTKIYDENGNPLGHVQSLDLHFEAGEPFVTATLRVCRMEADIKVPLHSVKRLEVCSICHGLLTTGARTRTVATRLRNSSEILNRSLSSWRDRVPLAAESSSGS